MADFLIHLVDASQPEAMEFLNTTRTVLSELGAEDKRILMVFNKVDKMEDPLVLMALRHHFPEAVFISVRTGEGMDELIERISKFVADDITTVDLLIPQSRSDLIARLHRESTVLATEYVDNDVKLSAQLSRRTLRDYAEYRLE